MSDKEQATPKQEAEFTLRHETVAGNRNEKKLADSANDTEGKPLLLGVSGISAKTSAPYLHNGIAETLEEIWTRYNPNDEHGVTNDMTKDQLNDLIEYLKTL